MARIHINITNFRATFLSTQAEPQKDNFDSLLTEYVKSGLVTEVDNTLVEHIIGMPVETLQEQVQVLSSISNYHWWASLDGFGNLKSSTSYPRYTQHMLFSSGTRYMPASPRNILMFCIPYLRSSHMIEPEQSSGAELRMVHNIMYLVNHDQGQVDTVLYNRPPQQPSTLYPTNDTFEQDDGPVFKKRKYASRSKVLSEAADVLLQEAGVANVEGLGTVRNVASQRSLFELFSENLHSNGYVKWRSHSEDKNVVIMNDYSDKTGVMKPLDYVHVTASRTDSGELHIRCTCKIYQHMQDKALLKEQSLDEEVDTVLPLNFTCMHCRFYATYLVDIQDNLYSADSINRLHAKVKQSEEEMNKPVVVLGEVSPYAATKFSVLGEDSYSIIHMSFPFSGCVTSCQSGTCQALFSHFYRRKIPRNICLETLSQYKMCDHLLTLCQEKELLEVLFPDYFKSNNPTPGDNADNADNLDASDEPDGPVPPPEDVNIDDFGMRDRDPGVISFDPHEGKWTSTSYSYLKTKDDRYDPDLVRSTEQRMKYFCGDLTPEGYRKGPSMSAIPPSSDEQPAKCECGCDFTEILNRKTLVYCRQV